MTIDPIADTSEAEAAASALIERGISRVQSGEIDAGAEDLREAERISRDAGVNHLTSAALIDQGWAASLIGDREGAIDLYSQAGDVARDAGDTTRLVLALANLSVELGEQGRHTDAIGALTEHLGLLDAEDTQSRVMAHVNRAMLHLACGDIGSAHADLDAGDDIAVESDDRSLLFAVRMTQADAYLREHDPSSARAVLEKALEIARGTGDREDLKNALMSLAQVCRRLSENVRADEFFASVEEMYRDDGDEVDLALALYWHGVVLKSMRRRRVALEKWREEEAIRRRFGQNAHLAECLFAQADVLRLKGHHEAAEPLFREAAGIFRSLSMDGAIAATASSHCMTLRALGLPEDALKRSEEGINAAVMSGDPATERRVHSMRAMALADLGETATARQALDRAEALCAEAEAHIAIVWTLARRAYVLAREGASAEDVIAQLKAAHLHALVNDALPASRAAVRKMAAEISSRCGDAYDEAVAAFRQEQQTELDAFDDSDMPHSMLVPQGASMHAEEPGDPGDAADDEE